MTIASVGTLGTGTSSTNNSTLAFTPSAQLDANNVGILVISADNTGTTDADFSQVTQVTDTVGNTYTKLGEWTNGQGAAAAGITCSVWQTRASVNLTTGGTVTVTFSGNITDKCCSFWEFTAGGPLKPAAAVSPNATDGAAGFGSVTISGLPSKQYLFFRGLAKEANSTANITPSASFTAITAARSRNNAAAVLVRGEFRIVTTTSQTSNPTLAVTGDTAGVFLALEEAFTGSAAVSVGAATAAGTGTFIGNFSIATAAVTVGAATASGSAGFAYHPVSTLTTPRYGLWGRRYVSFAGKVETPPFFQGAAAVTVGAATAAGLATTSQPHPVGQITQPRFGLFGRNYGSFAAKGTTHVGIAAVSVGAATAAATAAFDPPYFSGNAAVSVGIVTASGSGTFVPPTSIGTAAISTGAATATGSGTFTVPVYTGVSAATIKAATASGSGTFTVPVYSGTSAVIVRAATATGAGTFTVPVYTGSAAVSVGAATAAGTGIFATTVYSGNAVASIGAVTVSGSATFSVPPRTGTAAVTAGATTAAGSGSFLVIFYTGSAAVSVGAATASGAGTVATPIYIGTAAVTVGAATAAGAESAAATPPGAPGLEYTAPANRLYFTALENLLHYTAPASRLHYTAREED